MKRTSHLLMSLSFAGLLGLGAPHDGAAQEREEAQASHAPETTLVQVSFSKVDFIHTGELANFTGRGQRISFRVLPRELKVVQTGEDLLTSPDAFFAVQLSAFRADDRARSVRYCLDILRSLAVAPNSELELRMFLNVTHVEATNFVVHTFNSCALQAPPSE
jgi:hypothetical protein